jgi:hypothetical protein
LRRVYNKSGVSDIEILDYEITKTTKYLMELIIKTNIINNYKKRTTINSEGNRINLNYHWDSREIYFQIYLEKDETDEWKLVELWQCR